MPEVHPDIKKLMIEAIKDTPIDFTIIETVRTLKKQKEYYSKGKSKTLKSRHIPSSNKSGMCEAVDAVPYPVNWDNIKRFVILADHIKSKAKELNIPITWGGDFKNFFDAPHYELKH